MEAEQNKPAMDIIELETTVIVINFLLRISRIELYKFSDDNIKMLSINDKK